MIRSAAANTSSASGRIFAPASTYSSSLNREPLPAPDCTTTWCPWCTSSTTPSGVRATRFSLSLISLGTPTTSALTMSPLGRGVSDQLLGVGQGLAQHLLHLVELGLAADQRRGDLDHHVAAVVGAAVEAVLEQRARQEAADEPLALGGVEGLAGGLVLDQLDRPEVAVAADVADDRQVQQLAQGRPERGLVVQHPLVEPLVVHDVEVGQRQRGGDRVAA